MKCSIKKCKNEAREGYRLCKSCCEYRLDRTRLKYAQRRAAGLCIICAQRPSQNACYCKICTLKKIAADNLKNRKRAKEIGLLLVQQGHRCAYTGLPIILGVNASLDHIIPQSQGGTHELSNLQWIDDGVNRMRRTMPHDQFKTYLRRLAESVLAFT